MAATIIPFPVSGPARHPAVGRHPVVGAPIPPTAIAITIQAPARADAGLPALASLAPPNLAVRSGTPPTRTAVTGRPGVPAVPYAGPCRRARSARTPPAPGLGRPVAAQAPHAALLPAPPPQPDRLARALDGLRAALVQQNAALAAWRASLANLLGASASLHAGLAQHDAAMRDLDVRLSRLQATPQAAPRALTR